MIAIRQSASEVTLGSMILSTTFRTVLTPCPALDLVLFHTLDHPFF